MVGNIYCDLIFLDLASPPVLGEERRTTQFTLAVGGGGYITTVGLARLGVRTAVRAYVGRDLLGQFQLDSLRREKVDTSLVRRHPRLGSGLTVAFSTAGDRGFLTYPGCALEAGRLLDDRTLAVLRRAHHVHFAGMIPPFRARLPLLERLQAAHVTTSLDIGWNPSRYRDPDFRQVIRRVTVFMPSWRDAQWLTGQPIPQDAVRALGEMVPVAVIKLGAEGAIGIEDGRVARARPPEVTPLDTTGAGDAFDAGFIWAYLRGESLARCLLAGNICGALSTRAPGGTAAFPRLRHLLRVLREMARREAIA
ncbi:MAG: carbohydrate kinase family protein [Armatimonadota bacterium]|nr:carbohydrate kinase family protein [Armatimonadota bacterium]